MIGPLARPLAQPIAKSLLAGAGGGSSDSFDYIGSDALAAYDIAALKTGVTRCFRVRRSSDNSEQDCLTVAEAVTFCGAGSGYIAKWYDQNGSNDLTQSTTTQQPRIVNSGVADAGAVFDGSNDFVTLGARLAASGEVTIAAWFRPASLSGTQAIASNLGSSGNNCDYQLEFNRTGGKLSFLRRGTAIAATSTGSLSAGTFYHVAVAVSGTSGNWSIKFYINGVLDSTTAYAQDSDGDGTSTFAVGRAGGYGGFYLNGSLSDVRIYNVAKTAQEISDIYGAYTP